MNFFPMYIQTYSHNHFVTSTVHVHSTTAPRRIPWQRWRMMIFWDLNRKRPAPHGHPDRGCLGQEADTSRNTLTQVRQCPIAGHRLAPKTRGPRAHTAFLIDHAPCDLCRESSPKSVKSLFGTARAHLLCCSLLQWMVLVVDFERGSRRHRLRTEVRSHR
jgi:hypothetical protein